MTNDGILEENMEQNESKLSELEETEELTEDGQGTTESVLEEEQGDLEGMAEESESVSQGDAVTSEPLQIEANCDHTEIIQELRLINQQMEAMQTYQEERDTSLFEKELSKYNASEGISLCLLLFVVAFFIMKLIGGIIKCETE